MASASRSLSTETAGADPRIDVAGVIRSANGAPERLAEPQRVAPTLTLVRDLVWADQTTLAVLGRITPRASVRVWTAGVGGRMQAAELADAAGAQSITTTNGERGLVVTTDEGLVLLRAGSSWLEVAKGSDFAVPATSPRSLTEMPRRIRPGSLRGSPLAEECVDQRLPVVEPNSRCIDCTRAALSTSAQYRSGLSHNRSLERDSEMLKHLVKFQTRAAQLRDERGATAVEYGLMVALIAVVIIVAVTAIGTGLTGMFNSVASKI